MPSSEHKLADLRHNGERSREESEWTAECSCGWSESCRTKKDTRREYRDHILKKTVIPAKIEALLRDRTTSFAHRYGRWTVAGISYAINHPEDLVELCLISMESNGDVELVYDNRWLWKREP